jgi:hypothetical protein
MGLSLRAYHDGIAVDVLAVTIAVMFFYDSPFYEYPVPAVALAVMQGSSILFHLYYFYRHFRAYLGYAAPFDDVHNQYKWIEYAISATAGTIAVLSVEYVDTAVVVPIAAGACLQQLGGMLLDSQPANGLKQEIVTWVRLRGDSVYAILVPFLAAWVLQLTEFYFAVDRGGPVVLKFSYILFWSFFGLHCGLTLYAFGRPNWIRYNNPRWVETVYSCLGWTAKIAVFAVEWAHLSGVKTPMLSMFLIMHVFLVAVIIMTAY